MSRLSVRHLRTGLWLVAALAADWVGGSALGASPFLRRVRRDTEWLARPPTRLVGSKQHDQILAELAQAARRTGARVWEHEFPVLVPQVERAELTIRRGLWTGKHRIYPLWPASVRLQTTPDEGIRGRLVYIKEGKPAQVPARSLHRQIAVMEMSGGGRWRNAGIAGAQAVILLGSDRETSQHAQTHQLSIPIHLPRFYVPEGRLAEALRRSQVEEGHLFSRGAWRQVTARNLYALIKPARPMLTDDESQKGDPGALAIVVPFDSMSIVPELAPGADGAVDVAVALNLLRHFTEHPPARPMLFAFVDAYAINQLGVRRMLAALAVPPKERKKAQRDDLERLEEYRKLVELVEELEAGAEGWRKVRGERYRPLRRAIKDEVHREKQKINEKLEPQQDEMYRLRRQVIRHETGTPEERLPETEVKAKRQQIERLKASIEDMKWEQGDYANAQAYLSRGREVRIGRAELKARLQRKLSGRRSSGDGAAPTQADGEGAGEQLEKELKEELRERVQKLVGVLWARARERIVQQAAEAEAVIETDKRLSQLRLELLAALGLSGGGADGEETESVERPISFLIGLDLSDAGIAAGPCYQDGYLGVNQKGDARSFSRWLRQIGKEEADSLWPGKLRYAVNLAPETALDPPGCFVVGGLGVPSAPAPSFGTAGMTWATLDALRLKVDTPRDRADALDWERLGPQVEATFELLKRLLSKPLPALAPPHGVRSRWSRMRGRIVDMSPGEPVPRLPMRGYFTTLEPAGKGAIPGLRRFEFVLTGADGRFSFDALPGYGGGNQTVASYRLEPDGRIIRAIDLQKANPQFGSAKVTITVNSESGHTSLFRAVVFTCEELNVFGLLDARELSDLGEGTIYDAVTNTPPKKGSIRFAGGMMNALLPPDTHWRLHLRTGLAGWGRLALLNVTKAGGAGEVPLALAMDGFALDEPLALTPIHRSAWDFFRVDQSRLRDYYKAGIASRPIYKLQARTREFLTQADEALERDDGGGLFTAASGALANELRAYGAVRRTADDVIQGVVFLLLLLVPFSVAMERLLFSSPRVGRQIGAMAGVFLFMTGVLVSFHPAFRISGQPLMIVMAFGVLAMSVTVISVVHSRFKAGLAESRQGRAESSGARTSRMGLISTSIRLGIANMRKRKLRTALTGTTVVLITFALLCFMSTSGYSGRTEFGLGVAAPFTGVLVSRSAGVPLPAGASDYLETVLGKEQTTAGRYWWCNAADAKWRIHVQNAANGRRVSLRAALGVAAAEAKLTGLDQACPNWETFAEKGGCYLAKSTAERLRVAPGDSVVMGGRSLRLVGVFDGGKLAKLTKGLDGNSILPMDYSLLDESQRLLLAQVQQQQAVTGEAATALLETAEDLPRVPESSLIIVRAEMLKNMPGSNLRSVAVQAASPAEAREVALGLSERLAFPIYYSGADEVRVVAATPLLPRAPKSLLIPLIIAGLIIFNTMLSSIAERKREIYVYTSLGLAPLHVGFLFLAEALTYGLMGSIFGYVVGQGVAKLLNELGWLGGLTLNYSGTQAMATMLMVLAVVTISSLVPAYLAGRLATPSNEMRWRVPEPKNDVIRDRLPFTATSVTAGGITTFLLDYFEAHLDGSIGNFSSDHLRTFCEEVEGREVMGVAATIWLAPYDLGVRQEVIISVRATDEADVYQVEVELRRGSGQTSSWRKLNRVFLGDLRRQLLGWRKLSLEHMLEYITRAAEMLPRTGQEKG